MCVHNHYKLLDLLQNSTSHESKGGHNDCSPWCHLDAAEVNMPETPAMEAQSYSRFLFSNALKILYAVVYGLLLPQTLAYAKQKFKLSINSLHMGLTLAQNTRRQSSHLRVMTYPWGCV